MGVINISKEVFDQCILELENTTPEGLSIYVELASPKIYQFRYYIDKQTIEYIRNYCEEYNQTDKSCAMMSDEEKLLSYSQTNGTGFKDGYDAKYHRRSFGFSMFNDKYMDSGWNSEYIVDSNGNFVSQWDVIKRDSKTGELTVKNNAGKWINVSEAYTKDKSGNIKWNIPKSSVKEIANTESFNYAGKQSNEDEVKITEYVESSLKKGDTVNYKGNNYEIQKGGFIDVNEYRLTITYTHDAADKPAITSNESGIREAAKKCIHRRRRIKCIKS